MRKLLLFLFLLALPLQVFAEVKTIAVKYRAAVDLVPQVRQLLDEGEKVQAAGANLLLVADGESLAAAEQLIALLDQPQKNLLIRVRQSESSQSVGKQSQGQTVLSTKTGLTSSAGNSFRLSTSAKNQEQSLRVLEGERGLIEVAREIPYTDHWAAMAGRLRGYSGSTSYKTVATGFLVYPLQVIGDKVLLDIEPYIGNAGKSAPLSAPEISHAQYRTRLQVPLGQWYPLGSQLMQRDQISQEILAWRASNQQPARQLQIRIDPVE